MKKAFTFIKDRFITGVIILIPIIVLGIILTDTIKKIMEITAPLTESMTVGRGPLIKTIVAILVLVIIMILFFFVGGLIFKTYLGRSFKIWLEKKVLEKVPFYKTLRGAIQQFTNTDKKNYPVVEVDLYGNNNRSLGVITETLSDGRSVVYIPLAPLMNIGQTHIIAEENIKILEMSFMELAEVIGKIGFESNEKLK